MNANCKYMVSEIKKNLAGGTIIGPVHDEENESFGFQVLCLDGQARNVWVDCDPEGNSSGWLCMENV